MVRVVTMAHGVRLAAGRAARHHQRSAPLAGRSLAIGASSQQVVGFGAAGADHRRFSSAAPGDESTTLLFADGQLAGQSACAFCCVRIWFVLKEPNSWWSGGWCADAAAAVAADGAGDTWALIQSVQAVIETIHTTTGLPWWATLLVGLHAAKDCSGGGIDWAELASRRPA